MGCDIHCYEEVRQDGKWVATAKASFELVNDGDEAYPEMDSLNIPRDYWLFGLLNSVRTQWICSFPYRDTFPEDASPEVTQCYDRWETDAHSASSLTVSALKNKLTELMLFSTEEAESLLPRLNGLMSKLSTTTPEIGDDNHRIVFWFDN